MGCGARSVGAARDALAPRVSQDLRRELNEQMKANAKLRQVVLMTEDEKRINKDLIARVQEFRNTGRVGAGTRTGVLG